MYGAVSDNNDSDKKCCEAKVFDAKTLPECTNEVLEPIGISGPLVAKIPVVIAEPKIQIDIESEIELEEPAIEIKRVKKNLFLTQCKLINTGDCKTGKLFISGFIRKNIEYATAYCKPGIKRGGISGEIKHTTVDIPFECATLVKLTHTPIFNKSGFSSEREIFSNKMESCNLCEDLLGQNLCEQNFEHREFFTEQIFCELEDVKIFETDIKKNPVTLYGDYPTERVFKKITEKMVVFVRLKLLQKQQVKIPHSFHLPVKKHKKHSKKLKCFKHMKKW